jgi:hypothetical protein
VTYYVTHWLHSLLYSNMSKEHEEVEINYPDLVQILMAPHGQQGTGLVNPTWTLDPASAGCDCDPEPKENVGLTQSW